MTGVRGEINDKLESDDGRPGEDARRSTISSGGVPRYQTQWLLRGSENYLNKILAIIPLSS